MDQCVDVRNTTQTAPYADSSLAITCALLTSSRPKVYLGAIEHRFQLRAATPDSALTVVLLDMSFVGQPC